jgi:hypothetical protein
MNRYFLANVGISDGEIDCEELFLFTKTISISSDVIGIASNKANKLIDKNYAPWEQLVNLSLNDVTELSSGDFTVLSKYIAVR